MSNNDNKLHSVPAFGVAPTTSGRNGSATANFMGQPFPWIPKASGIPPREAESNEISHHQLIQSSKALGQFGNQRVSPTSSTRGSGIAAARFKSSN